MFISVSLHVDHIDYHDVEEYSVCNIGCSEEDHHSSNHHCDRCLNNDNRLTPQRSAHAYSYTQILPVYILDESLNDDSQPYKLYSRPPPNLL
jgi:hypothetical protein